MSMTLIIASLVKFNARLAGTSGSIKVGRLHKTQFM